MSKKSRGRIWSFRAIVFGIVLAFLPVIFWLISSLGCENPFDESACAGAVYLWLILLSFPLGFVFTFLALIVWLVFRFRKTS
jgi:RsiW-degrading membrane proteinase PrsW (M82 family)